MVTQEMSRTKLQSEGLSGALKKGGGPKWKTQYQGWHLQEGTQKGAGGCTGGRDEETCLELVVGRSNAFKNT